MPGKDKPTNILANVGVAPILYANAIGTFEDEAGMIFVDFGFVGPSFYGEHEEQENHLSRVAMTLESAEMLFDALKGRIAEHKRETKKKVKKNAQK